MKEPREHLVDTVNALDERLRAGLMLVYVHRGAFNPETSDELATNAVVELTGFSRSQILEVFPDLTGSFLKRSVTGSDMVWSFAHPTIADALTEILREKPHMMVALLRGVTVETILTSFMSEGAGAIKDALSIPANLNDMLVARLVETPDELHLNWSLFSFLGWRASDAVVERIVTFKPELLERLAWVTDRVADNPKLTAHARVHRLGMLADGLRELDAEILEDAALNEFDLSFFDSNEMLALIPPERLVRLGLSLRASKLPDIEDYIGEMAEGADLDEDPESHFDKVVDAIDRLEGMQIDPDGEALIQNARTAITRSVQELINQKEERDSEEENDQSDWTHLVTSTGSSKRSWEDAANPRARSIFDDIDQ